MDKGTETNNLKVTRQDTSSSSPVLNANDTLLEDFEFETVRVNAKGIITTRDTHTAKHFVEDLGNGVTLEIVAIPGGSFTMGSPLTELQRTQYESPQHTVTVKPFFMGKYEVTQAQYQAIMGNNLAFFQGENRPVEAVSWDDAVEFCQKLSHVTGRNYRLPSEAEWEYACRAGTNTPFYFGQTITAELANYNTTDTYGSARKSQPWQQTTRVGSFPANAFGLYDMHGNVWEWCQDTWHDNYNDAPSDGSAWISENDNKLRTLRGGSWSDNPADCRSAIRDDIYYVVLSNNIGFRVVCDGEAVRIC